MSFLFALWLAVASIVNPNGSHLNSCAVEDGNGVALCSWDGVVSGDCAPEYIGSLSGSALCIQKHETNPREVQECVEQFNTDLISDIEKCIRRI